MVANEKIDCNVEVLQDKHIPQLSVTNVGALQDIPQLTNITSFSVFSESFHPRDRLSSCNLFLNK